jgi:SAM-dependent methyltransferase
VDDITLERLAESLTAQHTDVLPFLPYLLQDLWELGSSPTVMRRVLRSHAPLVAGDRVLDLACGKGAVSVGLAQEFGCSTLGLDIVPEFVEVARQKAAEHGVGGLCQFEVADVASAVTETGGWDVAVWGAAGNLLGGPEQTLAAMHDVVRPGGWVLLDDAYVDVEEAAGRTDLGYPTFAQWLAMFADAGLNPVAADAGDDVEDVDNQADTARIRARADELAVRFPDRAGLFDGYVRAQEAESEDLDGPLVGVTWLLHRPV